jgi:HEAT repeat protein
MFRWLKTWLLLRRLKSRDNKVRRRALRDFAKLEDPRVGPALVAALADNTYEIRIDAIKRLTARREPGLAETLVDMIRKDPVGIVREEAAKSLEKLKWTTDDAELRARVALARKDYDAALKEGPAALEPLLEELKWDTALIDAERREAAADALGRLGDRRAVEPLAERLSDTPAVEQAAAAALARLRDPRVLPRLEKALKNILDGKSQARAVEALIAWGEAPAVELLARYQPHVLRELRDRIAAAVLAAGGAAVPSLLKLLKSGDSMQRDFAVRTLGKLNDPQTREPLAAMLSNPRQEVRDAATRLLNQLGDDRAFDRLRQRLRSESTDDRCRAVEELERLGDAKAVEPLLEVLGNDPSEYVRQYAAEALGKFADPRVVPALLGRLADPARPLCKSAAVGLGHARAHEAVTPLLPLLDADDRFLRAAAAEALGRIGNPRAVNPLLGKLRDPDASVREKAADALHALSWDRNDPERARVLALARGRYYGLRVVGDRVEYSGPETKLDLEGDDLAEVAERVLKEVPNAHLLIAPTAGALVVIRSASEYRAMRARTPMTTQAAAKFTADLMLRGRTVEMIASLNAIEVR